MNNSGKATKWQKLENREQLMLSLYDKMQALMAIAIAVFK
jgi:hypothetical protein